MITLHSIKPYTNIPDLIKASYMSAIREMGTTANVRINISKLGTPTIQIKERHWDGSRRWGKYYGGYFTTQHLHLQRVVEHIAAFNALPNVNIHRVGQ